MALYSSDAELQSIVTFGRRDAAGIPAFMGRCGLTHITTSLSMCDKTAAEPFKVNESNLRATRQDAVSCKIRHRPGKNVPQSEKRKR